MAASRDVGMLALGTVIGVAMGYFFRNAIAKVLGGASATQALYVNARPVARRYV